MIITGILGFRLRWPLARYVVVMLAGTIPTMSFVAEHYVTKQTRNAASSAGRAPRLTARQTGDQVGPRPGHPRADRPDRAAAHVGGLGVGQPDQLGEHERLAPLVVQRGEQGAQRHRLGVVG